MAGMTLQSEVPRSVRRDIEQIIARAQERRSGMSVGTLGEKLLRGQRVAGARREHRDRALAQQPEPGQRPLAVPRHRIWQHRQPLPAARLPAGGHLILRGRFPGAGPLPGGPGIPLLAAACGEGRAQHVTHRWFRYPGRGGDVGLAQPLPVQLADPRHHLRGQLGGPPRPLRPGTRPATPSAASAFCHRHTLTPGFCR